MPRLRWALLLGGAILLLNLGCGQGSQDLSPQARKFKDLSLAIIADLRQRVTPAVLRRDGAAVEKVLKGLYRKAKAQGSPLPYGLAVMDREGILLAGRYPNPQGDGLGTRSLPGQNYSNYGKIHEVFSDGVTVGLELYPASGKLETVCAPIEEGGDVLGMVCVGFPYQYLDREMGLSEAQFLRIDFND